MFIAKVKGNVVATQKVEQMTGRKLLIVEPLRALEAGKDFEATGQCFVAVDHIDAGVGDVVLVTQGSSARMTSQTGEAPVDCVVIGIVDSITLDGRKFYGKGD